MPALQSCGTVCTYACPCGARKSVFYRIWLSMTGFSITIGDEHFASHTLIISYLTALACDSEASDSSDCQCTLRFIVLMSCNRLQSPAAGKKKHCHRRRCPIRHSVTYLPESPQKMEAFSAQKAWSHSAEPATTAGDSSRGISAAAERDILPENVSLMLCNPVSKDCLMP